MSELVQIIYHSRATSRADTSREGMELLLRQARNRNLQAGLTGALLYGDGRFAQVLEGSEPAVRHVMASIRRDQRHTGIVLLETERSIAEPAFADWAMAGLHFEDGRMRVFPTFASDPQSLGLSGDCLLGMLKWMVAGDRTSIHALPSPARTAVTHMRHLPIVLH